MRDIADLLEEVADAFARGRPGDHGMRIPADPQHDGDLICSAGAKEIRRLRVALRAIARPVTYEPDSIGGVLHLLHECEEIAREALAGAPVTTPRRPDESCPDNRCGMVGGCMSPASCLSESQS